MEILTGSTEVTVNKSHFSSVGRDQINYYTTHQHSVQARWRRENLPWLEEFNEVKQGNILKDKDIGEPWLLCSREGSAEAAIYTAKIIQFGAERFTVKAYSGGRKAKKKWRRDFLKCSNDWRRDIPLFGYNKSSVPLLIFHGELIPIAHIVGNGLGIVGNLYIEFLRLTLGCLQNEIWIDLAKGKLCYGPAGPKYQFLTGDYSGVMVPSDVEFLKEDIVVRYLFNAKYDHGLFWVLDYSSKIVFTKEIPSSSYPQIISSLTNSTIAFYRNVHWWSWKGCLKKWKEMGGGMTRFCLDDDQRLIWAESNAETFSWLSQGLSVFHTHGIGLNEDLSSYELVYPHFKLTGTLQRSRFKQQRRQLCDPIYLFLLPSPSPPRHFYFWSHDPIGRIPLSRDRCTYLGLPFKLSLDIEWFRQSWHTEIYRIMHEYQCARGFHPLTTDFARFLRLPIFKVALPEDRFEELEKGSSKIPAASEDLPLPMAKNAHVDSEGSYDIGAEAPESTSTSSHSDFINTTQTEDSASTQQAGTMCSLLGVLFSSFTFEAVEDSGIPAVAI
ncbi:hypothetical protein L218DRAFT_929285 [Marasmius fiardii PR-910]|nr:hypothetical protein L218DRAFT_929285 [Marasmius fiardii PR-910]